MMKITRKPSRSTSSEPFSFTCPYLGMIDDPTTVTLFPSDANYCRHCKPLSVPSYRQQADFCLAERFTDCPLKQNPSPARMPHGMRWKKDMAAIRATFFKTAAGIGAAILLALFFLLWMPGIISDMLVVLAPSPASGGNWPTLTPSITPVPSATPTVTPRVKDAVTAKLGLLPTSTRTPTLTPSPSLSPTTAPARRGSPTSSPTPPPTEADELTFTPTAVKTYAFSTSTSAPSDTPAPVPSDTNTPVPTEIPAPTDTDTPVLPATSTPAPIVTTFPTDPPEPTSTRSSPP
jgi:hypothetical protein